MPQAAHRPCRVLGCGALVSDGSGYCAAHQDRKKSGRFADPSRINSGARGYGHAWRKVREIILLRDCALCQVCQAQGKITPANIVDHITAKAEGGTDDHDNLRAICKPCHDSKTGGDAHWRRT